MPEPDEDLPAKAEVIVLFVAMFATALAGAVFR